MGDDNRALMGAVVSFVFPGLGLLLTADKKFKGILIFIGAMVLDVVCFLIGSLGILCIIPFIFWLAIPLIHFVAALHSYDVLIKEAKGKPIIFK
jgi:hypothetical protein